MCAFAPVCVVIYPSHTHAYPFLPITYTSHLPIIPTHAYPCLPITYPFLPITYPLHVGGRGVRGGGGRGVGPSKGEDVCEHECAAKMSARLGCEARMSECEDECKALGVRLA